MEFSILNLLLVLLAAWAGGRLAARLGYPPVLGELLAGILLGPPLLGLLHQEPGLDVLAQVGILLMMLYIGMEIEPGELGRASKPGLLAAFGGFVLPSTLCYATMIAAGSGQTAALFVGVAAGVTSLAVNPRILVDLRLLDTRIAHVMMASALVTDTLCLIIFATMIAVVQSGTVELAGILLLVVKAVAFFLATSLVGLKVFPILGRRLSKLEVSGHGAAFMLVLLIAFGFAELAELAGLHGILGTFIAGLFLRERLFGRKFSREIMGFVRNASLNLLAPIFFVTAGFAVSLDIFKADLGLLLAVIALATIGKILGVTLFYLFTGNGWREGLTLGAGMNGRGAVEIIIAQIGLSAGIITQDVFSILVFMAMATTATVPVFLKWGTEWLHRRGELVRSADQRKGTLIVGAGPVARALGKVLIRTQPVWMIDRNPELCALAEADGMNVVCGSALEEEMLGEAQAAHVRTFVALTPNAEVNALAARLAHDIFYVPDIHVLNGGDTAGHSELLEHVQGTTIFGGAVSLSDWDYRVDHEEADRSGLRMERPMTAALFYQEAQAHQETVPLAVRRGDAYLPFHSGLTLRSGDRVILFQVSDARHEPFDRFDRLAAHCPVLDVESDLSTDVFFELAAASLAPRVGLDSADLARLLINRERTGSTVLLPGLAIPHAILEGEGRFEMVIARCRGGIHFPDEEEHVHAAFVLVGTRDERNFHLRALSAIAQIIQWPDFERSWLEAPSAEDLRRLVIHAARRRLPEQSDRLPPGREPAVML
ncbi:MAG TPA: cation:proton antiporter [Rhodothermales bacterium]|nr:cation:proton antiporter [Rhodothermales bacterium]